VFSKAAGYAIRAAVYLAALPPGGLAGAREIADNQRIPPLFLRKILGELRRQRIVRSVKGIHGGYQLARSAECITLWDLVERLEPDPDWDACCSRGGSSSNQTRSTLDMELGSLREQIICLLRAKTISDFANVKISGKRAAHRVEEPQQNDWNSSW
jgi:Rrf2 family protein